MNTNRRFLGCGASRNAYLDLSNDDIIIKKPIPERKWAGGEQNKIEAKNYEIAKTMGVSCFAKVVNYDSELDELTMEKCFPFDYKLFEEKFGGLFCQSGFMPNDIIDYGKVGFRCGTTKFDYLKVFAWNIAYTFKRYLEMIPKLPQEKFGEITDLKQKFEMFLRIHWEALACANHPPTNFLVNLFLGNDSNYRELQDILVFHMYHPGNFVIEDLWNPTQWGITKDNRFVITDYGFDSIIQCSPAYRSKCIDKTYIPGSEKNITCLFKTRDGSMFNLYDDNTSRMFLNGNTFTRSSKTVFMKPEVWESLAKAKLENVKMTEVFRVETDWSSKLAIQKLYDEQRITLAETSEFSMEPEVGLYAVEFFITEDNIVRMWFNNLATIVEITNDIL